jgi:hypothetical protein
MSNSIQLSYANIWLTDNNIIEVIPTKRITIELDKATELMEAVRKLVNTNSNVKSLVIIMSSVAFVAQDARVHITTECMSAERICSLALVSESHLANVVSTLLLQHTEIQSIPMDMFSSMEKASNWSVAMQKTAVKAVAKNSFADIMV